MNSDRLSTVWAPGALGVLSVLRIFTGLALLQHGTGKIIGFPVAPMFANVQIDSLAGIGGLVQLIGGPLFTVRPVPPPAALILPGLPPAALFLCPRSHRLYSLFDSCRTS